MRRIVLTLLALPLASAVQMEDVQVTFDSPLLAESDLDAGPWQWAILFIAPGAPATASGHADGGIDVTTTSQESVWMDLENGTRARIPARQSTQPSSFPAGTLEAAASRNWTTLVLEGTDLRIMATDARAKLNIHNGGDTVGPLGAREPDLTALRRIHLDGRGAGPWMLMEPGGDAPALEVHIQASDLRFAEWHGWSLSCPGSCGNAETDSSKQQVGPFTQRLEVHRYVSWNGPFALDVQAAAWLVVAGTTESLGLGHVGVLRLPEARSDAFNATGEALRLDGSGNLTDLRIADEGPRRFAGTLQGSYDGIRLGESPVEIRLRAAQVAAVAAIALTPFLLRWLWILARSWSLPESHQDVADALRVAPGASFRDLMRMTGFSNGALDWNLRALERRRLIASREYKNTKRFFWGMAPTDWKRVVVTGREDLQALLRWAPLQARFTQTDAVDALEVSRSTLQGWLAELLDAGMLRSYKDGRWRVYEYRPNSPDTGPALTIKPQAVATG